jgi:hypothetical protein
MGCARERTSGKAIFGMTATSNIPIATSRGKVALAAFALIVGFGASSASIADEAEAKTLLKAMSDYLAA